MTKFIDTEAESSYYRAKIVDSNKKSVLISNFNGSEQAKDLKIPPNCDGFGRIRHFYRKTSPGWPCNPLPIDPVCQSLGLPKTELLCAQVFQIAACNWQCWYCFVPNSLKSADLQSAKYFSAADLIDLYLEQENRPPVIDLTGGQPDLVPEWVPWMMSELRSRKLEKEVYLWSDDNLSNDYFWQFLSESDLEIICTYRNYSRVSCFKGYDTESFSFNTLAEPELFNQQFKLMKRLLALGIDQYVYATFTTPSSKNIKDGMKRFVDQLQSLDENLPLRTIPLEIKIFKTVKKRTGSVHLQALNNQQIAIEAWCNELENRFTSQERNQNIAEVPLKNRKK